MYVGPVEELRNLFNAAETEKMREEDEKLNEAAQEYYDGIKADYYKAGGTERLIENRLKLAKDVLCECMADIYMSSLIIDNPEKYSVSLRSQMKNECMSIMESATTMAELKAMFEDASEYLKDAMVLAEDIADSKDVEEMKNTNEIDLTPKDIETIHKFEDIEGKEDYAEEILKRVVKVFDAEREQAEKNKEKVQKYVDLIAAKSDADKLAESVEEGMSFLNNEPKSLFNAIFMNKTKMMINEDSSAIDLKKNEEMALAETICTYTLLECIHSLGFKTYTDDEVQTMKYQFFTGRE